MTDILKKIFGRKGVCQSCLTEYKDLDLNIFDSSSRYTRPGERLVLCRECFLKKVSGSFRNYSRRAIVTYPDRKENAYHFYTFKEMQDYNYTMQFIELVRHDLPPKDSLCRCQSPANYLWVDANYLRAETNYFWADTWVLNLSFFKTSPPPVKKEYLCGQCLSKEFERIFRELDIRLKEFIPPLDEDGFFTSCNS